MLTCPRSIVSINSDRVLGLSQFSMPVTQPRYYNASSLLGTQRMQCVTCTVQDSVQRRCFGLTLPSTVGRRAHSDTALAKRVLPLYGELGSAPRPTAASCAIGELPNYTHTMIAVQRRTFTYQASLVCLLLAHVCLKKRATPKMFAKWVEFN